MNIKSIIVKVICTVVFCSGLNISINAQECIRISGVDPIENHISITNMTLGTFNLSEFRFCSLFNYTLNGILAETEPVLGDVSAIPPGATVTVEWPIDDDAADVSIYWPTGSFSDSFNMIDFVQYGAGGLGREPQAVMNGYWTAGDFVENSGPMFFEGGCDDYGLSNWVLTGINDIIQKSIELKDNLVVEELIISTGDAKIFDLSIYVYDMQGRLVEDKSQVSFDGDNIKLNTTTWHKAMYICIVKLEGEIVLRQRFVKA